MQNIKKTFMSRLSLVLLTATFTTISLAQPLLAFNEFFYGSNNILYYDDRAECSPAEGGGGGGTLSGDSNEAKIWNYLIGQGFKDFQAAGIMGNVHIESGSTFSPNVSEFKNYSSWPKGGYGIVQWTASRRTDLAKIMQQSIPAEYSKYYTSQYATKGGEFDKNGIRKGIPVAANDKFLQVQLDFLMKEAKSRKVRSGHGSGTEYDSIKASTSLKQASDIWLFSFERPADQSASQSNARVKGGEAVLKKAKPGGGASEVPVAPPEGQTDGVSADGCACTTEGDSAGGDILLDPGHSGTTTQGKEFDPVTKLQVGDGYNKGETEDVFEVSTKVKKLLEEKKYKVSMTKKGPKDTVNLLKRAEMANSQKPALAVSIHTTPGQFGGGVSWVTPQETGRYRVNKEGKQIKFENAEVAKKSQAYAAKIVEGRKKNESGTRINELVFDGRGGGIAKGNISIVQLLSKVPWVYNEAGQTGLDKDKYAQGLADGIMAAVPSGGASEGETEGESDDEETPPETEEAPAADNCTPGGGGGGDGGSIVKVAEAEFAKNVKEYDSNALKYTTGRREAWCADFVSWVYKEAGKPFTDGGAGGWQHPSVLNLQAWFKKKHTYFPVGKQAPQPGDVAFYIGGQTPDGGSTRHVNIVISVNGNTMTTIGGNEGNKVKKSTRKLKLGSASLVGFGRLK